jgi:hypothetical protein
MILAVQGTRHLLDSHPQLAAAYHSDEPASIEPFALHVALANAGLNYFKDVLVSGSIDLIGQGGIKGRFSTTRSWMISFPPFLIFLTSGPKAPIDATCINQWLGYPVSHAFSKKDRKVSYPIADPSALLVRKMYQDRHTLLRMERPGS